MSMGEIEGIVEDSTYLIAESNLSKKEKRDLLVNLYHFNKRFDTSYTHFRCIDILLKYGHTYKIPVEQHPDYASNKKAFKEKDHWVAADFSNEKSAKVFLADDEHLYFDAGDAFWNRLSKISKDYGDSPKRYRVAQLILQLLTLSAQKENYQLFTEWYTVSTNSFIENEFDAEDGYPDTFKQWLTDDILIATRSIVEQNKDHLLFNKLKNYHNYLKRPNLKEELEFLDSLDRKYQLKFLLDFKTSIEKLQKSYKKETAPITDKEEKLKLLQVGISANLSKRGFHYGCRIETDRIYYFWYRDKNGTPNNFDDYYFRHFIYACYDPKEQNISVDFAIQSGIILRWQKAKPSIHPSKFHTEDSLITYLSPETEKSRKINWLGNFNFKIRQQPNSLKKIIAFITECLDEAGDAYFDLVAKEFPDKFFNRKLDDILHILEYGEGETMQIPKYIIFNFISVVKQLFAFHALDKGDDSLLKKYFDKTPDALPVIKTTLNAVKNWDNEKITMSKLYGEKNSG